MTKMKKVLGMVMAALMCFALTPMAAFADEPAQTPKGSITIKNALEGETYAVYKMLDLSYNAANKSYSYTVDETWAKFFEDGVGAQYVDINDVNGTKYVIWNSGKMSEIDGIQEIVDPKVLTDAALAYASEHGIAAAAEAPAVEGETKVSFNDLSLGYYLVKSTVGTVCSITSTDLNVTIMDKNKYPTVEKQVKENSVQAPADPWGKTNDAAVGEPVEFKSTIDAKLGARNYIYHDKMGTGLEFIEGSVVVTKGNETLTAPADYSVAVGSGDGCTFEVAFTQDLCDTLTADDELVIEYKATLTADAITEGPAVNEAQLTYGDNGETEWDRTTTYTWSIPVYKYTGENTPLADAEFSLSVNADGSYPLSTKVSGKDGNVSFDGLDSGTYYLTETKAPEGYNMMAGAIKVVIDAQGAITVTMPNAESGSVVSLVKVLNESGSLLPSTGGIGTTILYVVGGILVIGAIIYLVRRRSHSA